jgi:hypothetical protein
MPTYTQPLLDHITTAALDYWLNKGTAFKEAIQEKPLLAAMESKKKTFPSGKGNIIISVKGDYGNTAAPGTSDQVVGYQLDDVVTYYTPANLRQAVFPWKEMHIGITMTHTELKSDGITVVDSGGDSNTNEHSGRDDTVLVGLLTDALEDLSEQYARGMNNLLWTNGTADPKALAGMAALITDDPTTGTVAGLDRATRTWWRNRAYTAAMGTAVTGTPAKAAWGGAPITSSATGGGALITLLQKEYRQLTRYGGKPNTGFCGTDFLGALESELRANGNYSMTGFSTGKDISVGTISYMGTDFEYDPTLDALGKNKRCYWYDNRDIYLVAMQDEWRHQHSPARPNDKYVLYRGLTSTGQLCARRLNSAVVIDIT